MMDALCHHMSAAFSGIGTEMIRPIAECGRTCRGVAKFPQALVANLVRPVRLLQSICICVAGQGKKLFGIFSFPASANDTMLRQFSSRLPARARASCSRALGQASRFSLVPRRSMATVKVEGIPKV